MSAPPPISADDDTIECSFEGEEIELNEKDMGFLNKKSNNVETATPVAPAAADDDKAADPEQAVAKPQPAPAAKTLDDDSASEYTYEPGLCSKKRCCVCWIVLALIAGIICALYFTVGIPDEAVEIARGIVPTEAPTAAPTAAPTLSPTAAPTSQLFADILELLLPYTPEETLLDAETPQGQAMRQLVKEVEESGSEPIQHRILQRYSLMTLHLSTDPTGWDTRTGWNTFTEDECDWFGIGTCRFLQDGTYGVANIELSTNGITGPFPSEICAMAENLESIDLSSNKLTGPIPSCLKDFVKLSDINLSNNQFTGELPTGLLAISTMEMIDFSRNQLDGDVNLLFGSDTAAVNLNSVRLNDNNLTGEFPSAVSGFGGLSELLLHDNALSGEVPDTVCEMQGLDTFLTTITADCREVTCTCCTCY